MLHSLAVLWNELKAVSMTDEFTLGSLHGYILSNVDEPGVLHLHH